jgi:hypothetical protein
VLAPRTAEATVPVTEEEEEEEEEELPGSLVPA